jgi:hypothetical protein
MNPNVQQMAVKEVSDLISIGDEVISVARASDRALKPEDIWRVITWLSRSGQLIRKLYGKDSLHFENYQKLTNHHGKDFTNLHSNYYVHLCEMRGILEAIQHELEAGLVIDFLCRSFAQTIYNSEGRLWCSLDEFYGFAV